MSRLILRKTDANVDPTQQRTAPMSMVSPVAVSLRGGGRYYDDGHRYSRYHDEKQESCGVSQSPHGGTRQLMNEDKPTAQTSSFSVGLY